MNRTISSELASSAFSSLSRAWSNGSGASSVLRFEEAVVGGMQQVFGARMQHGTAVETTAVDATPIRTQPARSEASRRQGAVSANSGSRSIHSSVSQPEKEAPAPVIGTRDTCYPIAPACIDITAERRAAAEAQMTWEAYIKLHKNNSC